MYYLGFIYGKDEQIKKLAMINEDEHQHSCKEDKFQHYEKNDNYHEYNIHP